MIAELAEFAMRVARNMTRDPEAESIANEAALRAHRTFDETRGVPIKRWVAHCVKMDVWCYWRSQASRHQELRAEKWWEAVAVDPEELPIDVAPEDWLLLAEHYFDGRYLDVMARSRNISVSALRKQLRAAESRFLEAMR